MPLPVCDPNLSIIDRIKNLRERIGYDKIDLTTAKWICLEDLDQFMTGDYSADTLLLASRLRGK